MFTTGSKLFLGATVLSIASLVLLGITNGGVIGWTATVGLAFAMIALLFLTGINFYVRDSNVSSMQAENFTDSAAAQPAPGRSFWPIIAAVGAGGIVVGLVTTPIVFKSAVVVLLAVIVEWMVQAWSERASADAAYNAGIRKRILNPLEFPILAGVGLAVIIYSFSRIMLFLSKSTGPAVFGVIGALVLLGGILVAYSPGLKKGVVITVCTIAALGLVSTGAVMAIDGQRTIDPHEIIAKDTDICESNTKTEADEHASQSLAAKSNVTATVTLDNGVLTAHQIGIAQPLTTITLSRATPSNIVFVNNDDADVRLTAHLGSLTTTTDGQTTVEKPLTCTTLVKHGGKQLLTLRIPRSSPRPPSTELPYTLEVPGLSSTKIMVEVP